MISFASLQRIPALLRHQRQTCCALQYGGGGFGCQLTTATAPSPLLFSLHRCTAERQLNHYNPIAATLHSFSSLAYESQDDDEGGATTSTAISSSIRSSSTAIHSDENNDRSPRRRQQRRHSSSPPTTTTTSTSSERIILPTKHSRHLPPPACPPSQLREELHFLLHESSAAGSLIPYPNPRNSTSIKSVAEEIRDAYLASDPVVQRVEYVMRGLNACLSSESYVSRSLRRGVMTMDNNNNNNNNSSNGGDDDDGAKVVESEVDESNFMDKGECLCAMLDLIERMVKEGEAYAEVRARVRSQVLDPSATHYDGSESSSDSISGSSDDDGEEESGFDERAADESFHKWAETMNRNMSKIGLSNYTGNSKQQQVMEGDGDDNNPPINDEMYQFGADPGLTTHMFDLALDGLACLCHEISTSSSSSSWSSMTDIFYSLSGGSTSPPELATSLLDAALHRHWLDGGDIGLGDRGSIWGIGRGVGIGAGTGAGALWNSASSSGYYDVRTCPTPMTFNTVLRVTANFDPNAYAQAMDDTRVLQGGHDMINYARIDPSNPVDRLRREKERLRDVTIDAALSTYSRMLDCSALTLRALGDSTRLATSRSALKKRARILDGNYKGKGWKEIVSGRNAATYAYMIRTIGNIIPPSLSRGNMTFALYQKGIVEEGIMDEHVVRAMMSVGGYDGDAMGNDLDLLNEEVGDSPVTPSAPPISNGPLFDSFLQKDLGRGIAAALDEGRKLRRDRNYKTRRHVEWDGTY